MSKMTMYFDTKEQMDAYFTQGVPSNVLAIVKDSGGLYTSSNNSPEMDEEFGPSMGGEPISDDDRELVDNTLYGEGGEPEPEPELENDTWYMVTDSSNNYYPMKANPLKDYAGIYLSSLSENDLNDKFYFIYVDRKGELNYYYAKSDTGFSDTGTVDLTGPQNTYVYINKEVFEKMDLETSFIATFWNSLNEQESYPGMLFTCNRYR